MRQIVLLVFFLWTAASIDSSAEEPSRFVTEDIQAIQRINQYFASRGEIPTGITASLHHGKKTAKVFIFIHGFSLSHRYFFDKAKEAYSHGHNVIIAEVPGHGADYLSRAEQMAGMWLAYADYVARMAKQYGQEIIVVGHSLGGQLAIRLAEENLVHKIILLEPMVGVNSVNRKLMDWGNALPLPGYYSAWTKGAQQSIRLSNSAYRVLPFQIPVDIYLASADYVVDNQITRLWAKEFASQARIFTNPHRHFALDHLIQPDVIQD